MKAARESAIPVTARRSAARAFILPFTLAIIAAVGVGSVNEERGSGRWIAFDAFPEPDAMTCEWEVAALDSPQDSAFGDRARASFLQRQGGAGRGRQQFPALVPTATSMRAPLRFIQLLSMDIYNLFNASSVLEENPNYAAFRRPTAILIPRFVRFSAQFDF